MPGKFEFYKDRGGRIRFPFKATNGQVVGTSEQYETGRARDNGISSVRRNAGGASVVDLTA